MPTQIYSKLSALLTRRDKRNGVLLLIITLIGALLEVAGVGAIPAFVAVINSPEAILSNSWGRAAYDALGLESTRQMIFWAALGLIAVFAFKNAWLAFVAYARARYSGNRQAEISNKLFQAYLRAPYTFHLQRNTAELLRNATSEAQAIAGGVLLSSLSLIMETLVLLLIFTLLFVVEPLVTISTFVVLGGITVVFYRATRSRINAYAESELKSRKGAVQSVNQGLGGLKEARVLGRQEHFFDSYTVNTWRLAHASRFKSFISALPRLFLETLGIIGLLGVTALLVAQGREMAAIVPTLTLLAAAVVRLMPSFTKISSDFVALQWGDRALTAVHNDLIELRNLATLEMTASEDPLAFETALELQDLQYRYPEAADDALRGVSLTIPKNHSVAFVGPSGSGKTTIADVILGLLTPTGGQIRIDGVDVQTNLPGWQSKIGYIPQTIYLTDDSIRRNVAFGLNDEDISDEAIWTALDAAQLRELVESLPDGLDTFVGEEGVRLSGGQRQRIGIARALYHQPEVLVMDEATSALDNETERRIVEALEALQGEHTLLVIAHRLSTVRNCNTLFFLRDGQLEASGTYDELMASNETFRQMAGASDEDIGARPPEPSERRERLPAMLRWH